uniref:Uncharacterized protein n=2 Tax=Cannabis sativa TaxID=3483 RepID=A0A803PY15_CANSA
MAKKTPLAFPLLLCSILILVPQKATTQSVECVKEKGNYTLNSTYHDNLNHLLSNLPNPENNNGFGFYNLSYGNSSNQVYAIGLCNGDTLPDVCLKCINDSTYILPQRCPNQKETLLWYDDCMLRYSNCSLFGVMETKPNIIYHNTEDVPSDIVVEFFQILNGLLEHLKRRAAAGGSFRKFAAANATAPRFRTIYGLVQCTPDLSQEDCNNCLEVAFEKIPGCCDGKKGGQVLGTNCRFRYEDYLFYNSTAVEILTPSLPPSQQPTPSPSPPFYSGRGSKSNTSARTIVIIIVVSAVGFVGLIIFISTCVCLKLRRAKKLAQNHFTYEPVEEIESAESLQFSFESIQLATDNFSEENKLGQGGFGAVYKGRLPDGRDIAVKRLSKGSAQGDHEFKNEVILVAKLQHRNLVRLLGFSMEGSEKLLLYEFVQNTSLDHFIFDPRKRSNLDWDKRYKIIEGVVRGLLYLHEDSRLRIIHRDLKASNILLDEEMHPKISDFGMARPFVIDQTQDNTSRIVGTYGYMAPEYAMHGRFSIKSDVFSFGVLLLEIITGKKNNYFSQEEYSEDLLSYTWRNWREGNVSNIVDPLMRGGSRYEIMRCIHIGLLCVQENMTDRPTMNAVVLMLNSDSLSLSVPLEPAFFIHTNGNIVGPEMSFPFDFSSREIESSSDQSKPNPKYISINEISITELYPR